MPLAPRVFISHTGQHSDSSTFAAMLHDKFTSKGVATFHDCSQQSLTPGDKFPDTNREAASSSRAMVVVVTPEYFGRYWCMEELALGLAAAAVAGATSTCPCVPGQQHSW